MRKREACRDVKAEGVKAQEEQTGEVGSREESVARAHVIRLLNMRVAGRGGAPVVPAAREADAGGSLEPRSSGL